MRRFLQVADQIRNRIEAGDYPVGRRLPGRDRLAVEFGAGNSTVTQALAYLAAEGVIRIKPQSGAYPVPDAERTPEPWRVDLSTIRRNGRGYLLGAGTGDWAPTAAPEVVTVPCPRGVAVELGTDEHPVDEGDEVVARRRVVGPGYPVQATTTYLAPRLVEVLPVVGTRDTGPGGWLERLEEHFAAPFTGEWSACSRTATAAEALTFDLPPGVPVVEARRVIGVVGSPVAVEVVTWPAHRVRLVGRMTRRDEAAWPPSPATMTNSPGT
jgi:GntR family transcriptional regulator